MVGWLKITGAAAAIFAAALLGGVTAWPTRACADSWLPPEVATYESCSREFRLTVTPRSLENQLRFFEDKVDGVEPAGQAAGPAEARGLLERRVGDDEWAPVWDRPLVNEVGPVRALVSDSGDYVVTFDNWHSVGLGDDVVVIYGREGNLIRSLALNDILPETYIRALPRSVSSLWWSGEHRIEGQRLMLRVLVPMEDDRADEARFVTATIDLPTGQVQPLEGSGWRAARESATRVGQAITLAEAEFSARRRAPLLGPASGADRGDWEEYGYEAFFRLAPDWESAYPSFVVLAAPDEPEYERSLDGLKGVLRDGEDRIIFGAVAPESLLPALREGASPLPGGSLADSTVYVIAADDIWPEIQRTFAGSGATLVQIDPTQPIPQRPERMPE